MYISDISGKNNSKRSRTDKNKIQTDNSNSTSNFNSKGVADPVTARVSSIQHNYIKTVTSKANTHPALKTARHYAIMAAICLIIGIVYEIFSHDVISVFMIGAFIIPLVLGVLPNLCIGLRRLKTPCHTAENAYACGIITLTIGSFLKGVLDIFGTTNSLLKYYFVVGAAFIILGICLYFFQKKGSCANTAEKSFA